MAGAPYGRHHVRMTPVDIPEHLFVAIDHVGVAVADLDEATAFYRDSYGMQVLHEEVNEEQGVREAMVGVGDSAPASSSSHPCRRSRRSRSSWTATVPASSSSPSG